MIIAFLGSAIGGCSDDPCINGVCPDLDEARALPGPCRAATDSSVDGCLFTYTSAGQIASAACQVWDTFGNRTEGRTTAWSYDSSGQLTKIVESYDLPRLVRRSWTWDATQVQKVGSNDVPFAAYDRATFAFYPGSWANAFRPSAELGLRSQDGVQYTWSGTLRTGTDGSRAVAELDDRGRLVSFVGADRDDRFTYEGDLIVTRNERGTLFEHHYDRGGNLAEVVSPYTHEVYDYNCW